VRVERAACRGSRAGQSRRCDAGLRAACRGVAAVALLG
jgi:hypothetical protein